MANYQISLNEQTHQMSVDDSGLVTPAGSAQPYVIYQLGEHRFSVSMGSSTRSVLVYLGEDGYSVQISGREFKVEVETDRERLLRQYEASSGHSHRRLEIHAPMPALIVKVEVKPGDSVRPGQGLLVMEAMKMENELKSHQEGVVKEVYVVAGKAVEKGELLLLFE